MAPAGEVFGHRGVVDDALDGLGQSYGRVVRITDQEIVLRELVREGVSEWKEKMTSLKLEVAA